jgi:RNA polymerase sigma-70 factor (ECF subfamily)
MMNTIPSDTELVNKANNADATAFATLLERHYDLLYRVALRTVGNPQDAEDIAQDICLALPKKLMSFQGRSKFTTWLYQVTLNQCRDFMRYTASTAKKHQDFIEVNALFSAESAAQKKALKWVYSAINSLTEPLRETAILVVIEGLQHAEVAEIIGVKESTVSWRMMKVKMKLKAHEKIAGGHNDEG